MDTAPELLTDQDQALTQYIEDLLIIPLPKVEESNSVEQTPLNAPARKRMSAQDWSSLANTLKTMDVSVKRAGELTNTVEQKVSPVRIQQSAANSSDLLSLCVLYVNDLKLGIEQKHISRIISFAQFERERTTNSGCKTTPIDLGALVLSGKAHAKKQDAEDWVVILDRSPWALRCGQVGDTERVLRSDIRFRSEQTSRPWLLGTALSHRMAVIDLDGIESE